MIYIGGILGDVIGFVVTNTSEFDSYLLGDFNDFCVYVLTLMEAFVGWIM